MSTRQRTPYLSAASSIPSAAQVRQVETIVFELANIEDGLLAVWKTRHAASPALARPGGGQAPDQQQQAEQAGEHRQHAAPAFRLMRAACFYAACGA